MNKQKAGDSLPGRRTRLRLPVMAAIAVVAVCMSFTVWALSRAADTVTYSGPITITAGGTYTGNWESTDANVPAVRIETSQPVTITNSNIRSRGHLILGATPHIKLTVTNTRGYGLNPQVAGRAPGRFVKIELFDHFQAENNYMESTAGIYLLDYLGNRSSTQTVKVLRNQAKNIDGRRSNGTGGWQSARDYVQFVQFNKVKDLAGVEVAWNEIINEFGNSAVEDAISLYQSGGTSASPMDIHDNFIWGAFPPTAGEGYSGGGIMLGDEAHSTNAQGWVNAYKNHIVGTTNHGVSIICGHDQNFYENRVVSSGTTPTGVRLAAANVGLQGASASRWGGGCPDGSYYNNRIYSNTVGWHRADGARNDWWMPDIPAETTSPNVKLSGTITYATEQAEYSLWQNKLTAGNVRIGPATTISPTPTPPPPTPSSKTVLIVVGSPSALIASEVTLKGRLESQGWQVSIVDDSALTATQADTYNLAIMSKTVTSTNVGSKLKTTKTGVIFWEDNQQAIEINGVKMMGTTNISNPSTTGWHGTNQYVTLNANAPTELRAGLSGQVQLYSSANEITYAPSGSTLAHAIKVAQYGTSPGDGRWSLYALEANSGLGDGTTTHGRRYYFGLYDPTFSTLTTNGLALFDAAVTWTANVTTTPATKPGDVNNDGVVNGLDLSKVLTNYGNESSTFADGDLDGNGTINALDLSKVLTNYGK